MGTNYEEESEASRAIVQAGKFRDISSPIQMIDRRVISVDLSELRCQATITSYYYLALVIYSIADEVRKIGLLYPILG